jgi:hypothetical protein
MTTEVAADVTAGMAAEVQSVAVSGAQQSREHQKCAREHDTGKEDE